MMFSREPFRDHVARLRASADVADQARGENFRIEENVSAARLEHFEAETGHTDDLTVAAQDYFALHVQGLESDWLPTTFDPSLNEDALLAAGIDPNEKIVRVELIDGLVRDSARPEENKQAFEDVVAACKTRDGLVLNAFAEQFMIRYRGARPAFAAFRSEVEDDLRHEDWAERLCVRFGLLHHFGPEPKRFALMEYAAKEVLQQATKRPDPIDRPFALATVLECQNSPALHPVPRRSECGFAVDLGADPGSRALVREILHVRIAYRGDHVKRIRECRVNGATDIVAARAAHLARVRTRTSRDDFGAAA